MCTAAFLCIFLLNLTFSVCFADQSVKYAAIIYRHGDRTPVDTYPTDPYRNESLWPVRFGELTNIGKMQQYQLGQWLRKRYSHLLSNDFDPKEIYVRSSDVDRTLMSAQANLAGLYPPKGKSVWNAHLLWQPIPIHTVPEAEDEVVSMTRDCAAYNTEMARVINSKAYKLRLSRYQKLMDYLTAYTGRKISTYYDIEDIYSILHIESLYNFTLPDWTKSVYPKEMHEPACYSFTTSAATPLLARLRAGPLVKEVVGHMRKVHKNSTNYLKVTMYSGHDFTVGTLLTALGLYDGNCPEYTATVIMELVSDGGVNSVRILYRNGLAAPLAVLQIPYCGAICPLERFVKLYDKLVSVNFRRDCGTQFPAFLGLALLGGLTLFLTIYLMHKNYFATFYRRQLSSGASYGYENVYLKGPTTTAV